MIFQVPFSRKAARYRKADAEPLHHPLGVESITAVTVQSEAPVGVSPSMALLLEADWFSYTTAAERHLILEFDHGRHDRTADLSPRLPLTVRW